MLEDWNDLGLINAYFLLIGYALENLIKGMIVVARPELITDEKIKDIGNHRLVNLCNDAKLKVTDRQKAVLKELKKYIVWKGKYPAPFYINDMFPV